MSALLLSSVVVLASGSAAHAQVRTPEPMPRQAEQAQWRDPRPTDPPPAVRPRGTDIRVDNAQRRLDAQRATMTRDRQHADRLRALGAPTPDRLSELATQRQQQAEARQRAGLQQERDAAARDARLREGRQPARQATPRP